MSFHHSIHNTENIWIIKNRMTKQLTNDIFLKSRWFVYNLTSKTKPWLPLNVLSNLTVNPPILTFLRPMRPFAVYIHMRDNFSYNFTKMILSILCQFVLSNLDSHFQNVIYKCTWWFSYDVINIERYPMMLRGICYMCLSCKHNVNKHISKFGYN